MNNLNNVEKLRMSVVTREPFFGRLIISLPFIRDDTIPTFCTDAQAVYYNQDFANTLTRDEVIFVILHEVLHCAYNHIFRRGKRDPKRWNIACDYSINLILVNLGYKIPTGGLLDTSYANMSPEEIYLKLPEDAPENGFDEPCKDAPEEVGKQWESKAHQTAKLATKEHGKNMSNAMSELIDNLTSKPPVVDWRTILGDWVNERSRDEYSWSHPDKRFIASGVFMPGPDIADTAHIAFLIDTSGSMNKQALYRAIETLQDLLDSGVVTDITVLQTDCEVHSIETYSTGDTIPAKFKGRGGTDFTQAMALASDLDDVAGIICFTDMEIPSYACGIEPDSVPVIWAITGNRSTYERYRSTPSFGETFHIAE